MEEENFPQNQPALRRPIKAIPQEPEPAEKKMRIKGWMAVALITFAVMVDLSELVITWLGLVVVGGLISTVISAIAGFIFWIWYMLLGVKALSSPKNFAVRIITFVGELIPFLDAIPFLSFLWTIGTIITVLMIRAEDKGGVLGKAVGIAQTKLQYGGFDKQVGNMERLGDSKSHISGNTNTLDLKNKNIQNSQQSPNNKQQEQKQKRSANSDREINTLRSDIARYQQEMQQKEVELAQKERYYKENEDGFTQGLEVIRSTREVSKQEEAKWFNDHNAKMTSFYQDIDRIKRSIGGLKNLIPQLQNKITDLEGKK
ncbi:MAG: hypothetical protein WC657_00425 [Candidatus Paceibacterota bacterium]|jgi:hypothetical protein